MTTHGDEIAAANLGSADPVERVAASLRAQYGEWRANRTTVVLVREPVGV